jgi:hypothetical protein
VKFEPFVLAIEAADAFDGNRLSDFRGRAGQGGNALGHEKVLAIAQADVQIAIGFMFYQDNLALDADVGVFVRGHVGDRHWPVAAAYREKEKSQSQIHGPTSTELGKL